MKKRLANVSPWILAAAFTLLAFIIGAFAVNNYRREKAFMTEALLQKGLAVLRFLDTGVRVSMRANWQGRDQATTSWTEHVQGVIDQLHDQQDIHYVELLDGAGTVLAASDSARIGARVDSDTLTFARQRHGEEPVFRLYAAGEGAVQGFQVAREFKLRLRQPLQQNTGRSRMMQENMRRMMPELEHMQQEFESLKGQDFTMLVELDTQQFSSAVQRQLWQIVILSVVLLLVGAGGWLSLLTLQGFKGSQSRLRRISAFNDRLVEALPVGLIATDSSGAIRMVNEAAEKLIGVPALRLIGSRPQEILPELLARLLTEPARRTGQPSSFEGTIDGPGGLRTTLFLTVIGVPGEEGSSAGDVLLLQDVTTLRQLETELRRNERLAALGKMAAGVAHELRNPLSSIKGLAVLLKTRVGADTEGRQTADVLVAEVERLNRSISELLDYARPEKLQVTTVGLHAILDKAMTLVGVDAAAQGIRVVPLFTEKSDLVAVDEDKMNQVVLNLLLNAIQAMSEGGELRLLTEREERWLVCTIEDTGAGIAAEHIPRVFDPYFTTKSDGTGLGLALSAKIVEEHGGTIAINSILGKGTRVSVRLPAA